jgi:large subunit ribosomal protein L10
MALTRVKKAQKVETLAAELAGSTSAIVGTFSKLTVSQDFELRQKVRDAGGRYRVLKNKLASRASAGTGIEAALQGLKGVSSVAYTSGDPVALAKALSTWVKENAQFSFKLGIVDGKVITVEEVQALATMPGKEELFSKLLFLINSPGQRLATVIAATGRDLAIVVNQGVEKGKFAGAAEPAAAEPVTVSAPAAAAEPVAEVEAVASAEPVAETPAVAEAAVEEPEEKQAEAAADEAPAEG